MEPLRLNARFDRRTALRLATGVGGAAWLSQVASVLAYEAENAPKSKRAKSVILLWLAGGPSQLETFDPHPGTDIAGGTKAITTAATGVKLAEGFERLAEQMQSVALVRSLVSKEGDHERGTYLVKTGYRPEPTIVHPSIGAIVAHELPVDRTEIPRHISILPGQWPGRGGFLGPQFDAFKMGDPAHRVPDVTAPVSAARAAERLESLEVVDRTFDRGRPRRVDLAGHQSTMAAARRMMSSEQLAALEVSQEPSVLRQAYGDTPFGRGCLAARRLIEVGVRCVEVTLHGWDSHANNHQTHRELLATLDPAMATLLSDLKQRGFLDSTIVMCGGEFGRTPAINRLEGRDHWPHNFSFALAGGGIRGGQAVGETDPAGGRKVVDPYEVADLHATVFEALEIDCSKEILTATARPVKLAAGRTIEKLLRR